MNYKLKEAFEIAYDRNIYTKLVCRAVARSHQADWRRKRRLREETAGPEACGRQKIGPLETNFSETLIEIQTFSLKKISLKMSSAKCCSFRLVLNVLIVTSHMNP